MRSNLFTLCVLAFLSMYMAKAPEQQLSNNSNASGKRWLYYFSDNGRASLALETAIANKRLINAIIQVESGGNIAAVGDGGKAVGCLQIHPQMVKEVNRILGSSVYTLSDRKDRDKSIAMFKVYTNKYTPSWDPELVARRWNGGPTGEKKKATLKYWNKVQKELP